MNSTSSDIQRINLEALNVKAGDAAVRDALYLQFRPTMHRFVRRYAARAGDTGAWDLNDLRQETFLVFEEVVRGWSGEGDFIAYYFAVFPKRLATAVRRLDGRQPWIHARSTVEPSHDPSQRSEARAFLADFVSSLTPLDRRILALHAWEELPLPLVAVQVGLSLTETRKRWRSIRINARRFAADRS